VPTVRRLTNALPLLAVAALLLAACAPAGPRPLEKVRVTFPAKEVHYAPYLVAVEKGYYAAEGIELEIVEAAGNAGVAAVVAGDAAFTTSASAALSAILQGAELKVVFSHLDRPDYQVWSAQPEIRTLADLSGKSVAVIGRGDTTEISARLALFGAGLDPDGVAYTALGPGGARLAAVQSGAVAAAVLSLADVEQLKRAGPKGNLLVDVGQNVRMLFNGLATSDRLLKEQPQLVERFIRATLKGREYARQHQDEAVEIVGRYNGKPREANEPAYRGILGAMTPDGTLPAEAQLAEAKVRAGLVGAQTLRPIGEIYDYSIASRVGDELRRSGWRPDR
jgi:NitT/TauT family transport system substrate-binding protein